MQITTDVNPLQFGLAEIALKRAVSDIESDIEKRKNENPTDLPPWTADLDDLLWIRSEGLRAVQKIIAEIEKVRDGEKEEAKEDLPNNG